MSQRRLRPRPPVTAAPISISDETSLDLVGLDARRFRELIGAHKLPHTRLGHRVVVRAEVLADLLRRLESVAEVEDRPKLSTVDDVLALVGRRRSA